MRLVMGEKRAEQAVARRIVEMQRLIEIVGGDYRGVDVRLLVPAKMGLPSASA